MLKMVICIFFSFDFYLAVCYGPVCGLSVTFTFSEILGSAYNLSLPVYD